MAKDDWWLRLVYEDPTPVTDIPACHHVKWHVVLTRHLDSDHGRRFDGQYPLHHMTALHKALHD